MKSRLLASLLACLAFGLAQAETFPSRTITFVVPYAPGGPSDVVARALGQEVAKAAGQSVIVENRPGGGTVIGTQAMLAQPADGQTIGLAAASFVVVPHLLPKAPYDAARDVAPVTLLFSNPYVLVVAPKVPATDLKGFIDWAKGRKGNASYASFGVGSSGHLGFERFKAAAGIDLLHVPYKGAAPAATAVLSGEVEASFADVGAVMPYIKAGKLRAIAVAGEHRSEALPDVPTFAEAGMPGFVSQTWVGLITKAGVAPERVERLNRLFAEALAQPAVKTLLLQSGLEAQPGTPAAFAAFMAQEDKSNAEIIRSANIRLE
ncbi:Bug family tripartite tricarboxylate transporter substrate binding protein [Bordetella hinzii]|uniref:Bug family tripartite tricarboxylate transporter substrate binding protein n=1 Tax=Bordetella hinzii TaxID=103855 RepID=UPI0039FD9BE6